MMAGAMDWLFFGEKQSNNFVSLLQNAIYNNGSIHQFLLSYLSPYKVTRISHRCTSRYFFDLYLISKTKAVNTW